MNSKNIVIITLFFIINPIRTMQYLPDQVREFSLTDGKCSTKTKGMPALDPAFLKISTLFPAQTIDLTPEILTKGIYN